MNDLLLQRGSKPSERLHKIASYETTESIFDIPDDRFLMRFMDFFFHRHRSVMESDIADLVSLEGFPLTQSAAIDHFSLVAVIVTKYSIFLFLFF
ncbi:hypothetical protein CDAR_59081 [Caerostris darwini]|uniref:Maturase K n=1 Tax=Caerostris darwini TaxID=1538125 RepID=A0AAV4X273_9ARAC|nr:hypothetical protein CDAR_59081 [Caerostris darwini]